MFCGQLDWNIAVSFCTRGYQRHPLDYNNNNFIPIVGELGNFLRYYANPLKKCRQKLICTVVVVTILKRLCAISLGWTLG